MIRVVILAIVAVYSLAGTVMAADLPSRKAPPRSMFPAAHDDLDGLLRRSEYRGGWSANSVNNNNLTPYTTRWPAASICFQARPAAAAMPAACRGGQLAITIRSAPSFWAPRPTSTAPA